MSTPYRRLVNAVHGIVYHATWYEELSHFNALQITQFFFAQSLEIERILTMAANKKNSKRNSKPDAQTVKWVNRNLNDEEKAHHDGIKITPADLFKDALALALSGYNLSVKFDKYSDCFQATLIPYNEACVNYGFGLSARAADPKRAISMLLYKHFHVLSEDWGSAYTPPTSSFEG